MADYNSRYLDHREKILDARIKGVYIKARKELEESLAEFVKQKDRLSKAKQTMVKEGKMTEEDYQDWLRRAVFRQQQWEQKVEHCTRMISESNEKALAIIRKEQYNVYTEGANHQVYEVEKRAHFQPDISFEIYDMPTVEKMITEKPALLPPRRINKKKDRAWNQGIISNCITQGIIQGESVDKIAERIARETQRQNDASMVRYARTAITAAQNAGRIDTMKRTADKGIRVKKKWLATLDKRTRHSHQLLDGQEEEINRPFKSIFGKIMYPGDPEAEPGDVYNCRCTLEYVYPDFEDLAENVERYDQESGEVIEDMTYSDWLKEKQRQEKQWSKKKEVTDISKISTLRMYSDALEWAKEGYSYKLEELKEGWRKVKTQIDAITAFEDEIPTYEEILRTAIEREDFSTRTSSDAIIKILEDGRFKTQIETGASHGYLDIGKRKSATRTLFAGGESIDVKDTDYEIYGYLDKAERANMYGNCRIVLKKDNLIDRTTVTVGDSLELIATGADPTGTLANSPKIYSYGDVFSTSVPNAPQRLAEVRKDFESIKENGHLSSGGYVELQFHGGVKTTDIEYIEVSHADANAKQIADLAEKKGVKIKWKK